MNQRLNYAYRSTLQFCIAPAFEPVMGRNYIFTQFSSFLHFLTVRNSKRAFFYPCGKFYSIKITINRISPINQQSAYVSCIQILCKRYHVGIYALAIIYRSTPVNGFSTGAYCFVNSVNDYLYVRVIASANYQACAFIGH